MADYYPDMSGAKGAGIGHQDAADPNLLAEQLRRARLWAWGVFDQRIPGAARDLAWALIAMARDHEPETYSPWLQVGALETAQQILALELATDIARLVRKADELQPMLVRDREVAR